MLEEGHVTLSTPPNIDSFNLANKAPILHSLRKTSTQLPLPSPATVAPAPAPSIGINFLTSVLLIQTLAQSGFLSLAAGNATPPNAMQAPSQATPYTPTQQKSHEDGPSLPQPIPSSSYLTYYLRYAEEHLGIHHVLVYKTSLELNGIGPDILPDVDDKFLSNLGISAGDVIHLKKGSTAWWNGPDTKQKWSNMISSDGWASGE